MDHMRISGTEPSSVILSQNKVSPKSHHFFRPFSKKLMVGAEDMKLWFRIHVYKKKPSPMYHLSDHWWFNILCERFNKFKILRICDESVNFIIFHFLGKRSDMESRLHSLYWTLKSYGIGYGLNWRFYSTLKPAAFTEISHFLYSMLK